MKNQSYSSHVRYYQPHHFVFYPLILILAGISASFIFRFPESRWQWLMITALFLIVGWLAFMLRQHYALTVQNRVVRLEMRLRYFQLTGQSFSGVEQHLSFGQIAALRFAPDEELLLLVDRTLKESLSADTIKKSIKNWQPDHMRV